MEVDLELELSVGGSFRKPKMDSDLELRSCDTSEDAKAKREIQAMRRQEAKRKREEKKKGMRNGGGGGGGDAERMRLEAQRLQSRVKDRERRENDEAALSHRKSDIENRNQGLVEGSIQMMVPIQYAYPTRVPVQYVPFTFPCMVPYWAPAAGIQPVKPIPTRGGRSVLSEGWTNSSPSVSPQDGGSSDPQSSSSDGQGQSEPCVSSYHKASSSQGNQNSSEKSTSCGDKDRTSKLNSSIGESISSPRKKTTGKRTDDSGDSGDKPKKPGNQNQNQNQDQTAPPNSLEQIPCVSTTGNGPNGKTITGLLYRYTKTEICIVCVCHGSSFSPAGFVEHAGGVDVSQPLKHITVIPSDFP